MLPGVQCRCRNCLKGDRGKSPDVEVWVSAALAHSSRTEGNHPPARSAELIRDLAGHVVGCRSHVIGGNAMNATSRPEHGPAQDGEAAMTGEGSGAWLRLVRPVLDPADRVDWDRLAAMETELDRALAAHPVDLPAGAERSRRHRAVRRAMVERGFLVTRAHPPLYAVLAQFICGYRDIDLRDAVTLGHGELIDEYGHPATRHRWVPRVAAGELAGIAITEPHGGSRPA